MELLNFVAGEFKAALSAEFFVKHSPFDGQVLAQVTKSTAMDFVLTLQSSKKALPTYKETSFEVRAQYLEQLANALEEKQTEIAYAEALHQGLPQSFVLENSVQPSIQILRSIAKDLLTDVNRLDLSAVGVVGLLTPWCLSLKMIIERLAPALAAGNVVIVKVPELSPITGLLLGEALLKTSIPAGVVALLQGGEELAETLVGHPGIAAVSMAGKQSSLEKVASKALSTLKKVQLSGANKGAAIVLPGNNLSEVVPQVLRSFLIGQGQMCWNTTRVFIQDSFAEEFLQLAKDYLANTQALLSPEGNGEWTPLITEDKVQIAQEKFALAREEMGKVQDSGSSLPLTGYFVQPKIILDLPNCSALQQDDLQVPHLIITSVKYQHESVKWANNGYLGQTASIWGATEKLDKVAKGLEFSKVWKNRWLQGDLDAALGFKQSFYGNPDTRWHGSFYSNVKTLTTL